MAHFLQGFLLSLSLCLDLGLVNVTLVRTGLMRGTKPAFMIGLGSCVGDMIYETLSLVGLSFVLSQPLIRWSLWLGGTTCLVYLTFKMARESLGKCVDYSAAHTQIAASNSKRASARDFVDGVGLALSSPTAILWFATVGGSIIATSGAHVETLLPFFTGFFAGGVAFVSALAMLVGKGRQALGSQLARAMARVSALLFAYFAVKVFVDGYTTLLR